MEELTQNLIINNRYRLDRRLGEGSFGEVWVAEDTLLAGQYVAIKFYQRTDAEGQAAFTREYTRVQHLHHDNLLTATYVDVYNRRPYLVMEYCSEGAARSHRGQMTEQQIWQFIHDVAAGLAYMHSQEPPIIHQDIKPDNVLIHQSGRYLISDFGISRSALSGSGSSEQLKSAGTIAYMGPERFTSHPETIMASDIWSLGASAYELATGGQPFPGADGVGMGGVAFKLGFEMPALPSSFSPRLNETIQACMARETWDRPKAAELAKYTDAILRGENPKERPWTVRKEPKKKGEQPSDGNKIPIVLTMGLTAFGLFFVMTFIGMPFLLALLIEVLAIVLLLAFGVIGIPSFISSAIGLVASIVLHIFIASPSSEPEKQQPLMTDTVVLSEVETHFGYWTGQMSQGKPNGQGTLEYYSGDKDGRTQYTGYMRDGKRHGKGKLEYKNGNSFDGTFNDDHLEEGRYDNVKDNLYYVGTYRNDGIWTGSWYYRNTDKLYVSYKEGEEVDYDVRDSQY